MNAAIAPGASLQAARTEQGLAIEQAAETLRIGNDVLRLLEADQFESFSSLLYVGAYLRSYAELLGLDPEPLLKAVLVICGAARPTRLRFAAAHAERRIPRQTARRATRRPPPRLRLAAAVAVTAALAGAAGGLLASPGVRPWLDAGRVQELAARLTFTSAATAPTPSPAPPAATEAEPLAKRIAPPPAPPRPTVQVLDGSGDEARAQAVAGRLRALGYDVVATDTLRRRSRRTAVLAAEGSQAQAAALVAEDRRFGEVRNAPPFKVPAALHVVVGSDWPRS